MEVEGNWRQGGFATEGMVEGMDDFAEEGRESERMKRSIKLGRPGERTVVDSELLKDSR